MAALGSGGSTHSSHAFGPRYPIDTLKDTEKDCMGVDPDMPWQLQVSVVAAAEKGLQLARDAVVKQSETRSGIGFHSAAAIAREGKESTVAPQGIAVLELAAARAALEQALPSTAGSSMVRERHDAETDNAVKAVLRNMHVA